jgi:glyoxylase-like metal-dependent hydrolase (beta-lactamase superfamily II)
VALERDREGGNVGHPTWTVGAVRITRVEEQRSAVSAEQLFAGASTAAVARHRSWLSPFMADDDTLLIAIQSLLVEADGKKIVVDTCVGPAAPSAFESAVVADSPFLGELARVGFDRHAVDYVVCTHLHFDHIGWNTVRDGDRMVPTFPAARYIVTRQEVEAFRHATAGAPVTYYGLRDSVQPLADAGLLDLVEPGYRVTEGVWLEGTPGHSPGHVAVRIDSEGAHALITGDLAHHPVQWAEPEWSAHADADQQQSALTRRRLLAAHADAPMLIVGTHYAPPGAGYHVTSADGHRFEPSVDGPRPAI